MLGLPGTISAETLRKAFETLSRIDFAQLDALLRHDHVVVAKAVALDDLLAIAKQIVPGLASAELAVSLLVFVGLHSSPSDATEPAMKAADGHGGGEPGTDHTSL